MNKGIKRNGITIGICRLPDRKLPSLCVMFDGENCIYKVATFNSEYSANLFEKIAEDLLEGMTVKQDGGT